MRRSHIDRIYKSAIRLDIDGSSKFVLMSDCHRSDGGASDNFIHNRNITLAALKYYHNNNYTYIELGDGDELWENKRFDRIHAVNEDIFNLLYLFHRAGRLYFIYGNHDSVKKNPSKAKKLYAGTRLSCAAFHEGIVLKQTEGGLDILLLHGHQADFINYELLPVSRFLVRYIWRPLELIGLLDPFSPASNPEKKSKIDGRLSEWAKNNNVMLIAGHTHREIFPESGKSAPYINDGCCVYPYMISAVEISHGMVSQVLWSEKVRDDGSLAVVRGIKRGTEMAQWS